MATPLLGMLKQVPDFAGLSERLAKDDPALKVYNLVFQTMQDLGSAMKLNCHRKLIDDLNSELDNSRLAAIAALVAHDDEACSIFSTFFTTLEQAYHWPRNEGMSLHLTPDALRDHKLLVQVLHQEELRSLVPHIDGLDPVQLAGRVLDFAHGLLHEARSASDCGQKLSQEKQDLVNLLYRTSRGDWDDQGCYNDVLSHIEFDHLHETKRTNGGQRSTMEVFELKQGTRRLNEIPLLLSLAASSHPDTARRAMRSLRFALTDLQLAIAAVHDELFDFMLDEPIWGRTFAVFSKGCGYSTIGAGGADTVTPFRAVDALIGTVGDPGSSELLVELMFRSRHFPKRFRELIENLARARPSIRELTGLTPNAGSLSHDCVDELLKLRAAFIAFLARQHELFTMHTKKAMRIALALRAGQAKTSSGVQNAASPEVHIAHSLGHAVRVRFGDNAKNELYVEAKANAWPMFSEQDGSIGSARVRFQLATEVVVRPGDTVTVRVWTGEQWGWQRRTFSVVCAGSEDQYSDALASNNATATWVEVAVRKAGLVSSLLCNQPPIHPNPTSYPSPDSSPALTASVPDPRLPIRLSVKPASHFRIRGNLTNSTETLFVAQGGAAGIFLGWLRSQRPANCAGKYRLVIAARNEDQLSYTEMLEEVIRQWGPSRKLRVVLALSRVHKHVSNSRFISVMPGLSIYAGHADEFLSRDTHEFGTTYVCGSAAFGVGIVRCLTKMKSIHVDTGVSAGYTRTYAPIITSTLPPLRLHVAASSRPDDSPISTQRYISRAELAQHNSPGDLWMAIGNKVYDISLLPSFHPGGEKVTIAYAGRQAGTVFHSVHGGEDDGGISVEVAAMLGEMEIGTLVPFTLPDDDIPRGASNPNADNIWETTFLDRIVEIQNDLTNHSRFEQRPLGTVEQLPLAPPADVIRGSLDIFIRAWVSLFRSLADPELAESSELAVALEAAHARNGVILDEFQETVWSRDDKRRTARGLKAIFDVHLAAISRIHALVDGVKKMAWEGLQKGEVLAPVAVLRMATTGIREVIGRIGHDREWSAVSNQ